MQSFLRIATVCALVALAGCAMQKYRPAPVSPEKSAAALRARSLSDAGLRDYFVKELQEPSGRWPLPEWKLPDLTLAAFYFSPALEIARTRVAEAEAAIITAAARPNPSVRGDLGGETSPESPWIAGFGFSLPLETAGKRRHRITEAERLADTARWNLAASAWAVRAQVRSALLESVVAGRSLGLLQNQERLRAEQVRLLDQRLAAGLIPRPEVDAARILHTQSVLAVRTAEGRIAQARASLAASIGVPAAALGGIKTAWPGFDRPPDVSSLAPARIQEDAVLNRIDIRRALADYVTSEAALELEISRQYPNVDIGPAWAYEEGAHLFSVATALVLPVVNRNQGPIAEAKARREEMAKQFLAAQAAGIAASEQALTRYASALKELAEARRLIGQSLGQEQAIEKRLTAGESDRVALNGAELQTAVTAVAELDALTRAQQALGDLESAVQRPLAPGDLPPLSPRSPLLEPASHSGGKESQ